VERRIQKRKVLLGFETGRRILKIKSSSKNKFFTFSSLS
jgi:hypothetical protein